MSVSSQYLDKIKIRVEDFSENLIKKINSPSITRDLRPAEIHSLIFDFLESSPTKEQKMSLNYIFREEIKKYLRSGTASKLKQASKASDPQIFLEIVCDFWANFQRFAFGLEFICSKAHSFFASTAKYLDKSKSLMKYEVGIVPVLAVNQLKEYMEKMNLTNKFCKVFCQFLASQRLGKNVPRQLVKEGIEFFESSYHDYDAIFVRQGDRVLIRKRFNPDVSQGRHSKANVFFKNHVEYDLLKNCQSFYRTFTTEKSGGLNATEEISAMIKYIQEQQARASFYIHQEKNVQQYLGCINESMISLNLETRIKKASGLSKYFMEYDVNKPDYQEEIKNAWKVYSRIFQKSKKHIIEIYTEYFEEEGKNLLTLMEKATQFINAVINLNKKNLAIVSMMGGMLEFDRIRVESIEKILSCQMIKGGKYEGKYFLGAKYFASTLNMKIKSRYAKEEKYGQDEADLMNIFKILKYKTIAIKQLWKFLNNRLLEEIDMSKDAQANNSITLQTRIIEEIKKQSSENDVKNLQQCVKDYLKSEELTHQIKNTAISKQYPFFNQVIIKNNTFWNENTFYDIEPPKVLRGCIVQTIKFIEKSANIQFELFNGVSTLRCNLGGNKKYTFSIKNIYVIILTYIDEKPNKKMFYSQLINKIKPTGRMKEKAYLELSRYLIEMTVFGILKSNKVLKAGSPNLETCEGSDYFQINREFAPVKKVPVIKTPMLAMLPEHIKKAFAIKAKSLDEDEKQYEKDRKVYVEAICVKLLKHAHHNGGGTVTFDQTLNHFGTGRARQLNVNAKYLKETIEVLINKKFCERVEGKKNTFKYIA